MSPQLPGSIAALAGIVAGVPLIVSSSRLFRRAGVDADPYRPTHGIISSGPYKYSRNPMYVGLILIYAGLAALFGGLWCWLLLPVAVLVLDFGVVRQEVSNAASARELKAVLEYAVIAAQGSVIQPHDLPPEIRTDSGIVASPQAALPSPADDTADRTSPDERTQILEALEWAEGNRARAARKLGISRATLYRRLEEYGVPTKSKDAPRTQ